MTTLQSLETSAAVWYIVLKVLATIKKSMGMHLFWYASVNQSIIGSDNGLLTLQRQAIIWTNVGILPIGT